MMLLPLIQGGFDIVPFEELIQHKILFTRSFVNRPRIRLMACVEVRLSGLSCRNLREQSMAVIGPVRQANRSLRAAGRHGCQNIGVPPENLWVALGARIGCVGSRGRRLRARCLRRPL